MILIFQGVLSYICNSFFHYWYRAWVVSMIFLLIQSYLSMLSNLSIFARGKLMCFDNVYNSIFEFWCCTWSNILCYNLFVHLGDPWDTMRDHLTRLFKQSKVKPNSTWLRHWKNTRFLQKGKLRWTYFCATWCWCWLFTTSKKWSFFY
jgi:hypothetical protein